MNQPQVVIHFLTKGTDNKFVNQFMKDLSMSCDSCIISVHFFVGRARAEGG
jgi:hypothetical protein